MAFCRTATSMQQGSHQGFSARMIIILVVLVLKKRLSLFFAAFAVQLVDFNMCLLLQSCWLCFKGSCAPTSTGCSVCSCSAAATGLLLEGRSISFDCQQARWF